MKPAKILYVDDETMALKYFERLVSPLAPVLTASSVEEGRAMLREHGAEIAVLVCDQRMPGELGNELLRHARQNYPGIVRMLTTAYSELGEAIEAINSGEIYRYINKPWELESLRADLRNALELAELRHERDQLMRDKLLVRHSQLLGSRLATLWPVAVAVQGPQAERAVSCFAQVALACGCAEPPVDWHRWEHADLLQAEARRGSAMAVHLREWLQALGSPCGGDQALAALARAVGGELHGETVLVRDAAPFRSLLTAPAGETATPAQCAWLAWLLWQGGAAAVSADPAGWRVVLADAGKQSPDWLAETIERLGRTAP